MMENNNEQPKPKRRYKKRTKKVTPIKEVNEIPMYDPYTGEPNPHYEELTGKPNPLLPPKRLTIDSVAETIRKGIEFLGLPIINNKVDIEPTKEFVDVKTNNRFLVLFPDNFGVTPIHVKSVTRPSLVIKRKLIGCKLEISPVVVELIDLIKEEFKLNVKLNDILKEHKRFNLTIQTVNPKGLVIEEMKLSDCFISELNFSPLSYSDDNLSVTTITITPNDFTIV
jgi:hypothetical protein